MDRAASADRRKICRTVEEIREAGRAAAREMDDLTPAEISKVLALLAPYREQLIRKAA